MVACTEAVYYPLCFSTLAPPLPGRFISRGYYDNRFRKNGTTINLLFCIDLICPFVNTWLQKERGLLGLNGLNQHTDTQGSFILKDFTITKGA